MSSKLTLKSIRAFRYQGDSQSRDVRWDAEIPGFGVRVYPSGRKAFLLSYRFHSRKRMMVLGGFGEITLDQARQDAKDALYLVRKGIDPLEDRSKKAGAGTFRSLVDDYLADREAAGVKTLDSMRRRIERNTPTGWWGRKAASITRAEVAKRHREIGKGAPYEANRYLELLRAMFTLALKGTLERDYFEPGTPNPALEVQPFKERKRKRWVTPQELPALAKAIDAQPNLYVRAAIWLYLLTGVRKMELLATERSAIDRERALLRLPETKADEEQFVPLSAPAMAIIQATPEVEGNPFLLPGRREGQHLINIDKPWRDVRKAAGMEDVRLHDLRRSVGSWMTQASVDLNTIKAALRHASLSTTLIYARLGEDPARQAFEEHGKRIMEIAGKRLVSGGDRQP